MMRDEHPRMSGAPPICFADCELDLDAYELRRGGEPQPVEPQVFDLLTYLARHRGRLVSKQELIEQVWNGRVVSDAALSSRIKSARRAIGDDGERQRYIRTVHGRGFRFTADVRLPAARPAELADLAIRAATLAHWPVSRAHKERALELFEAALALDADALGTLLGLARSPSG